MKTRPTESHAVLKISTLLAVAVAFLGVGCSRGNSVYSDPENVQVHITPIVIDDGSVLPKDFNNQSVNGASVALELDGITSSSKSIRFQTNPQTNATGSFNGPGQGNRAILGLGTWSSRPVPQAEPITFDSKDLLGTETVGVNLQIDLKCDGTSIRVVNASGAAISNQGPVSAVDGYSRFSVSLESPLWISPTADILDPDTRAVLVSSNGAPVSLHALLVKFPAACLKNASTGAIDLARGVSTSAISWSVGDAATTGGNAVRVRRFSVGSEVYEGLQ